MKDILLIRFRAIAANLRQYISTSGTMYSKFFGFAGGKEQPVEDSIIKTNIKLYQIANGILRDVATVLLHVLIDTSANTRAMGKVEGTENLLLYLKTFFKSFVSGVPIITSPTRGFIGAKSTNRAESRDADAERVTGISTMARMVCKAVSRSLWVSYTKAVIQLKTCVRGSSVIANVINGAIRTTIKSIEHAFSNAFDTVNGGGITGSKLLVKSNTSDEETTNTLMKLSSTESNLVANAMVINSENILIRTAIKLYSLVSFTPFDAILYPEGSSIDYFNLIAKSNSANAELSSGIATTKATVTAGAIIWQNPKLIENNTLYIASVYRESQEDSTIYIE